MYAYAVVHAIKCYALAWHDLCSEGMNGRAGGVLSLADLEAQHDPTLELSHLIRNQR